MPRLAIPRDRDIPNADSKIVVVIPDFGDLLKDKPSVTRMGHEVVSRTVGEARLRIMDQHGVEYTQDEDGDIHAVQPEEREQGSKCETDEEIEDFSECDNGTVQPAGAVQDVNGQTEENSGARALSGKDEPSQGCQGATLGGQTSMGTAGIDRTSSGKVNNIQKAGTMASTGKITAKSSNSKMANLNGQMEGSSGPTSYPRGSGVAYGSQGSTLGGQATSGTSGSSRSEARHANGIR